MAKCIRYSIFVLSIALFISGYVYKIFSGPDFCFNVMLCGVLLVFVNNVMYSFDVIKSRIYFLFFNFVVFTFLIGRPTIAMFRGNNWWWLGQEASLWALSAVFVSLLCLFLGSVLGERLVLNYNTRKERVKKCSTQSIGPRIQRDNGDFIETLRIVSLILFFISIGCLLVTHLERLLFIRGRDYIEIYAKFQTKLPHLLLSISDMHVYFLCIFLATMPKKKVAFMPLMIYLLSGVTPLLIGMRAPIVLNAIFVFLYYLLRDIFEDKEKWLGYKEKLSIAVGAPASVIFLGAYNYIREGNAVEPNNIFGLMLDFIYKQGVSFEVLCIGYNTIPIIKTEGFVNYTFGGIIDYFLHCLPAQVLFGAKPLPKGGNNLVMALESNNFADRMSYASRGQEYLDGHGWGSSYLLETYADFGFIGIIIFSLFIGMLLMCFIPIIKKNNWFLSTCVFMVLTILYYIPRASATGWMNFLFTFQFIITIFFTYIITSLCTRKYSLGARDFLKRKIFNN